MDVLWLKSQGLAHQDIARLAGVSPKTLRSYFRDCHEGGIAGLKVLRFLQPQSELVAHQQTIEAYLRDHPPVSINEAIAAIRDLTRSPTQVQLFLKNTCSMKRLKTGVLPAKADPAVQATFKKKNSNPLWLKPKRARGACSSLRIPLISATHSSGKLGIPTLKRYRRAPTEVVKGKLEARFDAIFSTRTRYETLNQLLKRLHRHKAELLLVLERPDVPLHTNDAESDLRDRVKKRQISAGTRSDAGRCSWDTFASLTKTSQKLGVSL
jgi:hypothetical protein